MVSLLKGDCLKIINSLENNSLDLIITDPPYFIGTLTNKWKNAKNANSHITHLPRGMKFSRKQTENLYNFYLKVSKLLIKKLKPGGYFLSFSAPRLYHSIAMAVSNAGFEIRDMINWVYTQNIPKGMSIQRFIESSTLCPQRKRELTEFYKNFKTPMIKSCTEPICVAMKPTEGTFLQNELSFKTGLLDFSNKVGDNRVPANVITTDETILPYDKNFLVKKPNKKEKNGNDHPTIKPVHLIAHLIRLFSKENALVLDPFLGSGTTAKACSDTNRRCIGIEKNNHYFYNAIKSHLLEVKKSLTR